MRKHIKLSLLFRTTSDEKLGAAIHFSSHNNYGLLGLEVVCCYWVDLMHSWHWTEWHTLQYTHQTGRTSEQHDTLGKLCSGNSNYKHSIIYEMSKSQIPTV